jgi:hypothetical protein
MNYFRKMFKKTPDPNAIVNADRMFERGEKLTDDNIHNLTLKYNITDKNKASFEKDIRTEYDRLSQIKENDRQMRQKELDAAADEDALRELIKRNNIKNPGVKYKYTIGGMNKRRKTANKRRKSNKTRRQRKKMK